MGGGSTDFVVYVNGYFAGSSTNGFKPLVGTRVADTRTGTGGVPQQPLASGATLTIALSAANLPSTADAAVLTFTMISADNGSLAAYPPGESAERTNYTYANSTTTLSAIVHISTTANQQVTVVNNGPAAVDFAIDVNGYFAPDGGRGSFTPVSGIIYDTRTKSDPVPANGDKIFNLLNQGGIPGSGVGAVAITLTVVNAGATGYARAWGRDETEPSTTSINFNAGDTVSNTTIIDIEPSAGANSQLEIHNLSGQPLNVLIGSQGWFSPFQTTPNSPTNVSGTPATAR